jgi:hypothetical protein
LIIWDDLAKFHILVISDFQNTDIEILLFCLRKAVGRKRGVFVEILLKTAPTPLL